MHYYSHHIGDYTLLSRHLSLMEDLALRRVMDMYYSTERPVPLDLGQVARMIGMREHLTAVTVVLSDYFVKKDDGYHQELFDREIAAYKAKADRAKSANGKRWGSKEAVKSDPGSEQGSDPNHQPTTTNQEPTTVNQEPATSTQEPSTTTQEPTPNSQQPTPTPQAPATPLPSEAVQNGGVGTGLGSQWNPSKAQVKVCTWFRRHSSVPWSEEEQKAWAKVGKVTFQDCDFLNAYYTAPLPRASDYRRQDLLSLLNHWATELDRARAFQARGGMASLESPKGGRHKAYDSRTVSAGRTFEELCRFTDKDWEDQRAEREAGYD